MCNNQIDAKYLRTPQEQERLEEGMDAIYNHLEKKNQKIKRKRENNNVKVIRD